MLQAKGLANGAQKALGQYQVTFFDPVISR
jgi:hypothetical protein